VHLHGREKPIVVELPEDERRNLDMSDEEIHNLLPTALQRREEANRDDELLGEDTDQDVTWDSPVRVYQTHFMA
jgi:hypothetical protein